ncbi:DUF1349 domain-containing protein [Paenibacillus hodogayensis]|uniref:DUF1349 domain-containing protein n=1 Tax=Paenibacillus hodogayensis TaxID=279208 RepID=A0ABV5W488_9BACL
MRKERISWSSGSWSTDPLSCCEQDGKLVVEAREGSDFWQTSLYGFQRDNGHALLTGWKREDAVEVSFRLSGFDHLYDQAGLMLRYGPERWVKAGIEINDGVPHIGAVATERYSDWSLAPVPEWQRQNITVRASRLQDAVIVRARAGHGPWRTIRVCRLHAEYNWQAGPYLCAPTRAGFQVAFIGWVWTSPDIDVHTEP